MIYYSVNINNIAAGTRSKYTEYCSIIYRSVLFLISCRFVENVDSGF